MTPRALRVVKVGGSLLDLPELPARLGSWLQQQPPAAQVLVAGGGPFADLVRQADQRFQFDASAAHWMCVSLLTASARLVAALLPQATLVERFELLQDRLAREETPLVVFAAEDFLRRDCLMPAEPPCPQDWRVTSDSIAARLARAIRADELVLLKSTNLPVSARSPSAAARGFVDEYFATAARDLPCVRWVNLRA